MDNKLNVDRLGKVLSEILSDKYDVKITVSFQPKSTKQDSATGRDSTVET